MLHLVMCSRCDKRTFAETVSLNIDEILYSNGLIRQHRFLCQPCVKIVEERNAIYMTLSAWAIEHTDELLRLQNESLTNLEMGW